MTNTFNCVLWDNDAILTNTLMVKGLDKYKEKNLKFLVKILIVESYEKWVNQVDYNEKGITFYKENASQI